MAVVARHYVVELDEKIDKDARMLMLKRPIDTTGIVENAGYIRGLEAARVLYEEIGKHNNRKDED